MSDHTLNLTPPVYRYLQQYSLREHPVLEALRLQTHKMSTSQMQISPEQGQFMQLLVTLLNAKKTLDVGTFTGYSALAVALALPNVNVVTCDINVEWTKLAQKFWQQANVQDRIQLKLGPAVDTLKQLVITESDSFDFVFIDADKKNYLEYYELALQLVRPQGLIAIDNVLWDGKVADENIQDELTNVIRNLNQHIAQDERVQLSMLPIGDGLTLALRKS